MHARILAGVVAVASCGRIGFDSLDGALGGDDATAGPSCSNAIRDGDETGIDCGGSCLPCVGASCSDGTQCATGNCVMSQCELASGPPFWISGPALMVPRSHTACASNVGSILVVAGLGATTNAVATSELLAPFATGWVPGPSLSAARSDLTVAATTDGTLYAGFGYDPIGVAQATLEALPGSTWSPRTGTLSAHALAGGAGGLDGKLYALDNSSLLVYTAATDSWAQLAGPSMARDSAGLARGPDGLLYLVGGRESTAVAAVDAWDTSLGSWSSRASLHTARAGAGVVTAIDGRIYAIGGTLTDGTQTTSVEAYAPDRDRWYDVAALVDARTIACAATGADGRIYVAGGGTGPIGSTLVPTTETYGPVVALSPATAAPGATVSVLASNFAANAVVAITLDGTVVATGTSNGVGAVALDFVVPAIATGAHAVVGLDSKSQFPASALLQVP